MKKTKFILAVFLIYFNSYSLANEKDFAFADTGCPFQYLTPCNPRFFEEPQTTQQKESKPTKKQNLSKSKNTKLSLK